MRFTELIGTQDDYIEHPVITPEYHPCPPCGLQGKRKHTTTRSVRQGEPSDVTLPCLIAAVGLSPRSGSTKRSARVASIFRPRFPVCLQEVAIPMRCETSLPMPSFATACPTRIDMESHWAFVLANFSGVLCPDEAHDSGRTILFATDPLNNFTVFFVDSADHARLRDETAFPGVSAQTRLLRGRGGHQLFSGRR